MPRFRKTTWAMIGWTVLCAIVTVAWMSSDPVEAADLKVGQVIEVDDEFRVTLLSEAPPTFKIDNVSTSNVWFSYSNITMIDSVGAEHEPAFAWGQIGEEVPASGSVTKALDFGNIGEASAVSYRWECDACDLGEDIGRGVVFILMGGVYWVGMIVLFIVWLVTRPARTVYVPVPASIQA